MTRKYKVYIKWTGNIRLWWRYPKLFIESFVCLLQRENGPIPFDVNQDSVPYMLTNKKKSQCQKKAFAYIVLKDFHVRQYNSTKRRGYLSPVLIDPLTRKYSFVIKIYLITNGKHDNTRGGKIRSMRNIKLWWLKRVLNAFLLPLSHLFTEIKVKISRRLRDHLGIACFLPCLLWLREN